MLVASFIFVSYHNYGGILIGIIQGDVRYTYLSQMLKNSVLSKDLKDFYGVHTLVLPFKGIDENYRISQTELNLLDILKVNRIDSIFTGNANKELVNLCHDLNIRLYEMLKDLSFVQENAFLTAKGLIYDLHRSSSELSSYKILILGYGNIGFYVAKLLAALECDFQIYTDEEIEKKFILLQGYTYSADINSTFDIIINTIPKNLNVKYNKLKEVKIIDVASPPYGFDVIEIEKYKIDYEILSAIPSRFAPYSAAQIIKKYIENRSLY